LRIGFKEGKGTTTEKQSYSFVDKSVLQGKLYYRLKQIDYDGSYEYSKTVELEVNNVSEFQLEQNYPNPFNPVTKIEFSLRTTSKIVIEIFNIIGQKIYTLVNRNFESGNHEVNLDASAFPSGTYFYKLIATGNDGIKFTDVKKMVLMK